MSETATSSAIPERLFRYANSAEEIDYGLVAESASLSGRLEQFEGQCSEPQFRMRASHLSNNLHRYGEQCKPVDQWVRQIGLKFRHADLLNHLSWPATLYLQRLPRSPSNQIAVATIATSFLPLFISTPAWLLATASSLSWLRQRQRSQPETVEDISDSPESSTISKREQAESAGVFSNEHPVEDISPLNISPEGVPLNETIHARDYTSCAEYAQARRPNLGRTGNGSAYNYINVYKDTVFQITGNETDLRTQLARGYAIVWERRVEGANSRHGHVAIVEEVGPDFVIVSHAGWGENSRELKMQELKLLHIIP